MIELRSIIDAQGSRISSNFLVSSYYLISRRLEIRGIKGKWESQTILSNIQPCSSSLAGCSTDSVVAPFSHQRSFRSCGRRRSWRAHGGQSSSSPEARSGTRENACCKELLSLIITWFTNSTTFSVPKFETLHNSVICNKILPKFETLHDWVIFNLI